MSERFIKTDLDLLAIPGLSSRLRELYGRLCLYAGKDGKCYPKWKTLAAEIGVKNRITVYRLLRQLKALRLIDWKRFGRHANQYQVLVPDVAFLQRQALHKRNVSDVAELQPRKEVLGKEVSKRPPNPPHPPSLCASDDAQVDVGYRQEWFTAWWAIYWRKVSRKDAQKAFLKHVKTQERFAQVMAATKAQTPTMMAREPEKRPHGATWLNAERWNDEPSTPATARKPPESQSVVEQTKALIAKRLANGERPI